MLTENLDEGIMKSQCMHDMSNLFSFFLAFPQVLHPQSMRPAREGDIPVRVKNSYNPNAPGTLITRTRDMSKVCIRISKMIFFVTIQMPIIFRCPNFRQC